MSDLSELNNLLGDEALIHYASGQEQDRLSKGAGSAGISPKPRTY
ncbi:hypothetical protein NSTCB13_02894 [Nostoc sp. DSM 114160]|jgi:hypothetical protein